MLLDAASKRPREKKISCQLPGALADLLAVACSQVLSTLNVTERIEKTLLLLKKELELSRLQSEISKQVEDKMSANQRRYMLMEQLEASLALYRLL